VKTYLFVVICLCFSVTAIFAGDYPEMLIAFKGTTPTLDGYISEGEYADAELLTGVKGWFSDTKVTTNDSSDLSVKVWYKHDGSYLYFAFDVCDDVLFGYDVEKWTPDKKPKVNELSYKNGGWPYFADGVEIFMNPASEWDDTAKPSGDGMGWQVICSTLKSTLGGLDQGGLIEGVPYTEYAWANYKNWIEKEYMKAAVRLKSKEEGRGYVVEWRISPNPCLQTDSNNFVDLNKETKIGINIEFQDLDEKAKGDPDFFHFRHVAYLSKAEGLNKSCFKSYATLLITPHSMITGIKK
jgi:SSS family solute:Na+ symporter